MHPFICLIGPSGAGKTTLMREAIARVPNAQIVQSVTTRLPRANDPDEARWYDFVSPGELLLRKEAGRLLSCLEYAHHFYAFDRALIEETLTRGIGFQAVVESVLPKLRAAGIPLACVLVKPIGFPERNATRTIADAERTYDFVPDLVLPHRYLPEGLDTDAIDTLVHFARTFVPPTG